MVSSHKSYDNLQSTRKIFCIAFDSARMQPFISYQASKIPRGKNIRHRPRGGRQILKNFVTGSRKTEFGSFRSRINIAKRTLALKTALAFNLRTTGVLENVKKVKYLSVEEILSI